MAVHPEDVKNIIEALALHTNQPRDTRGYIEMSDHIENETKKTVSNRYLYDTYRTACKKLEQNISSTKISEQKMDAIAQSMGYRNFTHYKKASSQDIDPLLNGCIGNWWSIVRANTGMYILKAPVKISLTDENKIAVELQGGQKKFFGTIHLRAGNLFCEIDSKEDKKLFIVLRLGSANHPRLLQGTFAGVSSAGEPIAGKELFLREEQQPYEEMRWQKLKLDQNDLDPRINAFFSVYERNCIKTGPVSNFSLSDLDQYL